MIGAREQPLTDNEQRGGFENLMISRESGFRCVLYFYKVSRLPTGQAGKVREGPAKAAKLLTKAIH